MIRVLVMVAVAGFLLSVVSISSAVAIAGPDILTDGVWNWGRFGDHLNFSWTDDRDDWGSRHGHGAQATRQMAWTGADAFEIDVPADVTYTQGAGPAKLTVTGDQRAVNDLVLEGGALRYAHGHHHHRGDLVVTMTAPGVNRFTIDGSSRLAILDYKQDKLSLEIAGNGEVNVKGEARSLGLDISGSGETDLAELKLADATVSIQGSGQATLAPTGAANIDISGSGDVTLLTRPAHLQSNVSGSGSVRQRDGGDVPAPPPPPKPGKSVTTTTTKT